MSEVYHKGLQKELQLDLQTLNKVIKEQFHPSTRLGTHSIMTCLSNISLDFPCFGRSLGVPHRIPLIAPGEKKKCINRETEKQQLPHLQHWRHLS